MIRFIDLFAGIGGIRKGFELACRDMGRESRCVFTSEIKPHAIEILSQNHPGETVAGDITRVDTRDIPDFDFLLAGFPCQAFSAAGLRRGFEDTRGTLFFDVARILKDKKPRGFVLENVEGLVNHDKASSKDPVGRTLQTILRTLDGLGYKVSWKVLNAKHFGVPQDRRRIYIAGSLNDHPDLEGFVEKKARLADVLESGLACHHSRFVDAVLQKYAAADLVGKSFKDKRGGKNNIHSWDIETKGPVSPEEKALLEKLLTERRKKAYASHYGIDWMDGMPLTLAHIKAFAGTDNVEETLESLVERGYLVKEHPKRKVGGKRVQDKSLPLGYNIVAGKMSFEVNKVLDPDGVAPTLVAMDMHGLFVADGNGLRRLTLREGLRLFGYPDDYSFDIPSDLGYDLLGNTVVVPVIRAVSSRILETLLP